MKVVIEIEFTKFDTGWTLLRLDKSWYLYKIKINIKKYNIND